MKFCHFFKRSFFPSELILKNLSNENDSRGIRRHALPENFWKFTYCNGHFSAFWTIFRQILFIILAPNFECFTKYDAFCLLSFDYACFWRLRHIVMKRFEIVEKFYASKALLKVADGGCIPHISPWIRPWSGARTAQTAEWYRTSVSWAVESGLIPSRVKPMTLKLVFTASLLDAQQ